MVYHTCSEHFGIGYLGAIKTDLHLRMCTGRRENGNKWTPVSSKVDDIRRGHQQASGSTNSDALLMTKSNSICLPVSLKQPQPQPYLNNPRQYVLRIAEATVGNQRPTRRSPYVSSSVFPLSSDHLIPLLHYNVWRAIVTNMILLGSEQMLLSCQNDDDAHSLVHVVPLPMPPAIPPSLQPTLLQKQINHEPWIDLFPLPALRDTLIRAEGTYDECDLCCDMVGGIVEKDENHDVKPDRDRPSPGSGASKNTARTNPKPRSTPHPSGSEGGSHENKGLIVWGNPEYIGSWEVSEGFAKKWGWMISEGCGELLRATDSHRRARSDDPIAWERFGINWN